MKKIFQIVKKESSKLIKVFRHPTFVFLTVMGNGLLILATIAVYLLEKDQPNAQIKTYFDALWWGASTITTVAYGDILPQTIPGRWIGIILMYTGTVLFVSFTGVLLSTLLKEEVEEEIAPLQREIRKEEKGQAKIEVALKSIAERLNELEKKIDS